MSYCIDYLILTRDPLNLINTCNSNKFHKDLYNDYNSELWEKISYKYYSKYIKYKKNNITYKDFYYLLYTLDNFKMLNEITNIFRVQKLLSLLPKIYDGDHIAIIHAISNIAIKGNFSKVVMYRDLNEKNLPIFGNGYLIIQFRNARDDIYIQKTDLDKYKFSKYVHPYYGGYNLYLN